MTIRDIIEHFCPEDTEKFCEWAFGEDFRDISMNIFHDIWNERHGEKYLLKGDSRPKDDLPKMVDLWKSETNSM